MWSGQARAVRVPGGWVAYLSLVINLPYCVTFLPRTGLLKCLTVTTCLGIFHMGDLVLEGRGVLISVPLMKEWTLKKQRLKIELLHPVRMKKVCRG